MGGIDTSIKSNTVDVTVLPSTQTPQYVFTLDLIADGSVSLPYFGGTVNMTAYVTSNPSGADLSGISIEVVNTNTHKAIVQTTGSNGSITVPMQFPNNIENIPQSYTIQAYASGGILGSTVLKSNPITVQVNSQISIGTGGTSTSACITTDNIASNLSPYYFVNSPNPASAVSSIQGQTTITQSGNDFIIKVPYPSNYTVPQYYKPTGMWYEYDNLGNNQTVVSFTVPSQIMQNGITYNLAGTELYDNPPTYGNPSFPYGSSARYTYLAENGTDTLTFFEYTTVTADVSYASYTIAGYCVQNVTNPTLAINSVIQKEIAPIISPSNPSSVINLSIASAVIE